MEPVRTHRNKIVVDAARLHRARTRRELSRTLIEGPHLLSDAVAAGVAVDTVFALPEDEQTIELASRRRLRLISVDRRALTRLAGTESPRGPVAVIEIPEPVLDDDKNLLVGWGLADPGNVGTLVRTAAAFGWGYADVAGSADPWSPKALRAGAGGQMQTPVSRIGEIGELSLAWTTVAAVIRGGVDASQVRERPLALLIGGEAPGLPEAIVAAADIGVSIATPGPTQSLNAAAAAAILVNELSKHEGQTPSGV